MRPNRLIIQAFGPFAGTEEIDFDQLGSNPLFLINGPTGSGKSSILDAICFALYGQTTGKERDASQMRCDHADDRLLTEITLVFSLGDQQYRIRRSPTQDKPKARGEGYTLHQTEACLWQQLTDGETVLVPKKAQEATRIIEEKTGLKVEQFRQVMVLPQGKFREFLMADSSQRENIFGKLFQTQIYKRIEDRLKDLAAGIRKDVDSLRNQIMGILQGADLNAEIEVQEMLTELNPKLDIASTNKKTAGDKLAKAEKQLETGIQLEKAFQTLAKTQSELNQLKLQEPSISDLEVVLRNAQTAQKIDHYRYRLNDVNLAMEQLQKDIKATELTTTQQQQVLTNNQKKLTQAEANQKPLDDLKIQLDDLRKLTPKIDDLANATAKVDQLHGFWKYADKTFNDHQQAVETTIESSLEFEQQAHQLRNQLLVLPDKFSQRDSLVSLGKHRAKLDGLLKQQTELETLQSSQISIVNQVQSEFGQQNIRVKKLEFSWHNNQAALLAAELQIGEVCPVCGSTEHPLKAVFTTESVSKEDVEKAKDVLLSLQNKANEAQNELTQYETQLNGIELAIVDSKTELGDFQFQTTEQLRQDCKQLNSELKKLEQQQILLTKHESDLKLLAEKRIEAERHLELSRENQQNTLREYELSKQTKEQIEQQLPEIYRQPGQLMKSISNLNQQIEDITQAYENALKEFNLATQMLTQLTAKLEQQNSQLKLTEIELSQAKSQWLGSLKSSNFEDESSFLNALRSDDQQQQLQQQIKQFNDQLTGCNATLNQQTKQLKEQKQPDMDLLRRKRDELTDISNETLSVWKHIDNRFQQLNDVQDKLDQAHKTNRALEEEYKIYGTLSDIANGQTGNRISLQRFVLSVLLDDVLEEASHRLNIMSKGRYLLLRKEDKAKGGKASGLELEVEDAYTGKTRSVATLSGGESFMAALSLALGLSDVVQAYAGGIKLDTLFIDEGFGSLDQESLDLAIKTLIDLQATGRMIGIISHVSELREQMPLRIDVITSASGSRVG